MDVVDLARRIVQLGTGPEGESICVSMMRLQKLLYFSQGWSLALLGRPLFDEVIEAWKYGPVVPKVYHDFKRGSEPITQSIIGKPEGAVSETTMSLIEAVWRNYASYTPIELANLTHQEPAWLEARGGLPADAACTNPLSLETMTESFRQSLTKRHLNIIEDWQVEDAFERSGFQTSPASDVWKRLGVAG
jgi:uncharacterized phage-associated protein